MLLDTSQYMNYGLNPNDSDVTRRLQAVEAMIRKVTNNPFQVRAARFEAETRNGVLMGASPHIKAGDTVQVSRNSLNDGVYVVKSVEDGVTTLTVPLFDDDFNRVTLVRYPADVIEGAVGIIKYEDARPKEKAGIASETLSRHSVSVPPSIALPCALRAIFARRTSAVTLPPIIRTTASCAA